jgi:hypothetical protein
MDPAAVDHGDVFQAFHEDRDSREILLLLIGVTQDKDMPRQAQG